MRQRVSIGPALDTHSISLDSKPLADIDPSGLWPFPCFGLHCGRRRRGSFRPHRSVCGEPHIRVYSASRSRLHTLVAVSMGIQSGNDAASTVPVSLVALPKATVSVPMTTILASLVKMTPKCLLAFLDLGRARREFQDMHESLVQ